MSWGYLPDELNTLRWEAWKNGPDCVLDVYGRPDPNKFPEHTGPFTMYQLVAQIAPNKIPEQLTIPIYFESANLALFTSWQSKFKVVVTPLSSSFGPLISCYSAQPSSSYEEFEEVLGYLDVDLFAFDYPSNITLWYPRGGY